MAYELIDESQFRRVWPLPDQEPVDVSALTPAVRSSWITDAMVRQLEEEGTA
ncbi:hypothetical protein PP629_gp32 [Streptomyces phage Dubu]|uniref:Uncharacterized protein n=1 Tax=Streptomyces phage Dubu TaxID=2591226 RepID=A0A514DEV5_9CAUD|nr:hypothetical protein PP629_gp32 [Streptomyces phage Dubu]QDH92137.1 hypothetical protein SEA_DUBU_32 [Streptomyces phage Dubu]